MPPRFTAAQPRLDGGTDFFAPDGSKTTLFGPSLASYGASLGTGLPALAPPSAAAPGAPTDYARASALAPDPAAAAFVAAQGEPRGERPAAGSHEAPAGAPVPNGSAAPASFAELEAKTAPAPKGEPRGKAKASGPGIGIGDVTAREAPAGARGPSALDEARMAYKADLMAAGRGGGTKAHWQDTTQSTVREGTESAATAADRQNAIDQLEAAQGQQAENARGQDQTDSATLREAARHSQGTQARLEAAAGVEEKALLDREARLRAEANESPLGFAGSSTLGKINKALTRASETAGSQEGDAIIMSANGGGSVASIMAAKQAAKDARLGRQDRQNDEADKARAGVGQLRANIEKIKSAEYADYLANTLKANAAEYKASGRLGELQASLAALEEKKAALRGDREAKQQGTTTSGRKFVPASSGGSAAALAKYGDRMAHIAQIEAQMDRPGKAGKDTTTLSDGERSDLLKRRAGADERLAALSDLEARDRRWFSSWSPSERRADAAARERLASGTSAQRGEGVTNKDNMDRADETFGLGLFSSRGDAIAQARADALRKKREITELLRRHGQDPEQLWPEKRALFSKS